MTEYFDSMRMTGQRVRVRRSARRPRVALRNMSHPRMVRWRGNFAACREWRVVDFCGRGAVRGEGIGTRGSGWGGRGRGREREGFWGRGVGFITRPRCATGNGQEAQTPGRGENDENGGFEPRLECKLGLLGWIFRRKLCTNFEGEKIDDIEGTVQKYVAPAGGARSGLGGAEIRIATRASVRRPIANGAHRSERRGF